MSITFNSWYNIEPLSDGGYAQLPSIEMDSVGAIHCVYYDDPSTGGTRVRYRKSTDGGATWGAEKDVIISGASNVGNISDNYNPPRICIDSSDNLYIFVGAADTTLTADEYQIRFVKSTDGGNTWSNPTTINGSAFVTSYLPHVIYKNNVIHLVCVEAPAYPQNGVGDRVKYSKSTDGGSNWSEWSEVVPAGTDDVYDPYITIDTNNVLHVVYASYSGSYLSNIHYTQSTDNGDMWSDDVNISNITNKWQDAPKIIVGKNNSLHIFWAGANPTDGYVKYNPTDIKYSKSTDAGETWSNWTNISGVNLGDDGYQWSPVVAYSSEQDLLFVLFCGDGYTNPDWLSEARYVVSADNGGSWSEYTPLPANTISPNGADYYGRGVYYKNNTFYMAIGFYNDDWDATIDFISATLSSSIVPKKCTIKVRINSVWRKA
jgi:hypothetical protein